MRARPWILQALALVALAAPAVAIDLPEIQQRGQLRVLAVVVDEEPEFFALAPGVAPGFDHELIQGFAHLQRLQLQPVRVKTWSDLVPALLRGDGDVIAGRFTATESRRTHIAFSQEVFPSRVVAVTRRPHRVVRTLEELGEERIGLVGGSSLAEVLARAGIPAGRIDASFTPGTVPAALAEGRITCMIDEVAAAFLAQRADPDLQLGVFVGAPESYAWGVRQEDRALLAALDAYLENVRRGPTWNRLVVKYFGESALQVLRSSRR